MTKSGQGHAKNDHDPVKGGLGTTMGKWCRVRCNCPNRKPVDIRHPCGAYECGHDEGAMVALWPGYFFDIGKLLGSLTVKDELWSGAFEVFVRISDPSGYVDEYLALSPAERNLWRLEIEELLAVEAGRQFFPYAIQHPWNQYWAQVFQDPRQQQGAVSLRSILLSGMSLCEASVSTGNPVEFYL
jgi:hypothetical protein